MKPECPLEIHISAGNVAAIAATTRPIRANARDRVRYRNIELGHVADLLVVEGILDQGQRGRQERFGHGIAGSVLYDDRRNGNGRARGGRGLTRRCSKAGPLSKIRYRQPCYRDQFVADRYDAIDSNRNFQRCFIEKTAAHAIELGLRELAASLDPAIEDQVRRRGYEPIRKSGG